MHVIPVAALTAAILEAYPLQLSDKLSNLRRHRVMLLYDRCEVYARIGCVSADK